MFHCGVSQLSRAFDPGKPKYEWVHVKDDLPPDDPKNPSQSIVVKVKCFGLSWIYHNAYYVEATGKWYIAESGYIIGSKANKTGIRPEVIYWTNVY